MLHIAIIFASVTVSYTQDFNDSDFEDLIREIQELKEESVDDYEYEETVIESNPVQEEYLKTPIEKKSFDREKWNKLRQETIEEALGEGGRYQEGDSPYGNRSYSRRDNPYENSQRSYERYWDERKKNERTIKRRSKESSERNNSSNYSRDNNWGGDWNISPVFGWILIGVCVLLLVGLIFYLFFKAPISKEDKKIDRDIESLAPTEIPKTELQLRLAKAIAEQDYRKAVRIYFIFILRGLSEKQLITWEKEKTNFTYLTEVRSSSYYKQFDEAVLLYELVWYGKREVTQENYNRVEPVLKKLTNDLDQY